MSLNLLLVYRKYRVLREKLNASWGSNQRQEVGHSTKRTMNLVLQWPGKKGGDAREILDVDTYEMWSNAIWGSWLSPGLKQCKRHFGGKWGNVYKEEFNGTMDLGFILLGVIMVLWLSSVSFLTDWKKLIEIKENPRENPRDHYLVMKCHVDYKYFKILRPKKERDEANMANVHKLYLGDVPYLQVSLLFCAFEIIQNKWQKKSGV